MAKRTSVKKTVGIFSKYDATEKTFCALYLAEHVIFRYRRAVWLVPDDVLPRSRYHGFSHKWDAEVLSLKSQTEQIRKHLPHFEMCVFFDENEPLRSLLHGKTKTALFLDPCRWGDRSFRSFAEKCTYTFSVSPYVTNAVVNRYALDNAIFCPFDHCLQMMPKASILSGKAATLFYPAYGMTHLERQCLRQISEIVKACCPESKSVIGYYNAKDVSAKGMDAQTYDWKLLDYLKQTDWIIDLNPRPLMGLFASFAGALGIQWSCFDLPPNTDAYSAARRHIVPFPKGGLTVANAEMIAGHLVRQLSTPFNDDTERHRGAGSYLKRLGGFTEAMNRVFKKKKTKKKR